jgi:alpha-N-arabinofuranosidase
VQRLLGNNRGETYLHTRVEGANGRFTASTVKDGKSGDLIIKLVNGEADGRTVKVKLNGSTGILPAAIKSVLSAPDPNKVNTGRDDADGEIIPIVEKQRGGSSFELKVEPNSLTGLRIPGKKS